jgi:DNA-binding winged helix-turn-helix (wHTH) protein/TolB-like protein
MATPPVLPRNVRFGVFEANLATQELFKQGMRVRLRGRPFSILAMLLERAGDLVTREEFRDRLWPADTFVDFDHGLDAAVNRLREALGDAADNPRFVETVPRRGYRFIAPVVRTDVEPVAPRSLLEPQPLPRLLPVPREPSRSRFRWFLGATLVTLALASAGIRWLGKRSETAGLARVAVLPLELGDADPSREHVADGLTAEIIDRLAEVSAVRATSAASVLTYRRTQKTPAEIAGELNVDALVKGSLHLSPDGWRADVEVVDPETVRTLLARSHEGTGSEILSLGRAVAEDVVEALHVASTPQEQARLRGQQSVDPLAHEAALRGRSLLANGSPQAIGEARNLFEESVRLDASYADGEAGLAESLWGLGAPGIEAVPPTEAGPKAREAALRALDLDPRLDAAEATLARVEIAYDGEWAKGEGRLRRVLARSPSRVGVRGSRALLLAAMERFDDSVSEAQRGRELDPWSKEAGLTLGRALYYARRYEAAIVELRKVLEAEPTAFAARLTLAQCHWQRHEWKRAIPEGERALSDSSGSAWALAWLGYAYGASGDRERGRAALARLEALGGERYVPAFYRALVHVGLDQNDDALADLEAARRERSGWMVFLKVEPELGVLRSEPRFQELLRKVGRPY